MATPVNPEPISRRERAQATRRRIIVAATELFCDRGYTGTRMTDVGSRAGVAVQTVYFTFHTKAELLRACYAHAVLGARDPTPPAQQAWYAALLAAESGAAALRHFAEGNGTIVARVALLDDVVRSATHEPDALAVRARSEQLRREGYRTVIDHIAARFGLRAGLDAGTATDVLLMLGGAGPWRSLVVDYGWSQAAYVDWQAQTLADLLLAR